MRRLFSGYDFFSTLDRDMNNPLAREFRKRRDKPNKCRAQYDMFGEIVYDWSNRKRGSVDSSSESDDPDSGFQGLKRPQAEDDEVFLYGFFYFFLLQDPFIN